MSEQLNSRIKECKQCVLCNGRTQAVPGEGSSEPLFIMIGEAPGADEDLLGRPFVGASGKKLRRLINAGTMKDSEVYITNTVKCRPPNNRVPMDTEIAECRGYLLAEIAELKPKNKIIVTLGNVATKAICGNIEGITKVHGRLQACLINGYQAYPLYHPSYLLRNPGAEPFFSDDLVRLESMLK